MNDLSWSKKEKSISKKAFDKAYEKECAQLIGTLKKKAEKLTKQEDIWELQDYLNQKQKEIDQKYDYRYSVLILVFAQLLKEGWVEINDLKGLNADKVDKIKSLATFKP